MTFRTTHELLHDERQHKESLRRLEEAEPEWRPRFSETAAWTKANIGRQLAGIDGELRMANQR